MWRCVPATWDSPQAALAATPCPHSRASEATALYGDGLLKRAVDARRHAALLLCAPGSTIATPPSATCKRSSQVSDISLEDYIAVKPKFAVYVPHTAGRYQKKRFRKAQCPIVER